MDLTLENLLASLATGMDKRASDDKAGEKDDKKDFPFAKKDDGEKKEDKDDKDDKDKKDDCPCPDDMDKKASEQGTNLAQKIMEKVANINLESVPGMKKTAAADAGKTLANELLKKLASAGDVTTVDGVAPGAVPNKNQADSAQVKTEDDQKVQLMQTSDGNRPQGSVNEIFDAVIADVQSQGAAAKDQVAETGVAAKEGGAESAVPNQVQEKMAALNELLAQGVNFEDAAEMIKQAELTIADDLEKVAAIQTLVEQGMDFESASDLVKEAAEAIAKEEDDLEKVAAVNELIAQGIEYNEAVEMVKEASAGDLITDNGITQEGTPNKNQVDNAQMKAEDDQKIKPMLTSDGNRPTGSINEIFDAIVADALSQGAASTDQVHSQGVAAYEGNAESAVPNQVKSAAMEKLIATGVDFEKAASIVKEASEKAAMDWKGLATMAKSTAGRASAAAKGMSTGAKEGLAAAAGRPSAAAKGMSTGARVGLAAGAGAGAGLAAGKAMSEKKAEAISLLVGQGVDFNEAAEMVKKASEKLGV